MYEIDDLFDKRSVVGARVSQILVDYNSTKAELCKQTGVSRPTLDKLLAGSLTTKKNFEKHISKILSYLEITPDKLLGNVVIVNNRTRIIRNLRKLTTKELSKNTGISSKRLEQIESGEEATVAELRDIATCLSIGVKDLMGENFFEPQVSVLDDFVSYMKGDETTEFSGFWGHIGILLSNTDKYLWYPITGNTRKFIYKMIENERIVVPCMNNKVLYLYMPNIKEILLLDDACDQPSYANWDNSVSCGEIPFVVFEALEDYLMLEEGENEPDIFSKPFKDYLDKLISEQDWSEDDIEEVLHVSEIYYADGKTRSASIEFDDSESLTNEISDAYCYENSEFSDNIISYNDIDGSENFINVKQISMLELPMLKVEDALSKRYIV